MCGIAGIIAFNNNGRLRLGKIDQATECLSKRGPDSKGIYKDDDVALGHRRLSIIDTSEAGNQPMTDASGRYQIVFNGEFFNYREHIQYVTENGFQLKSTSDTEVLLYLYIIDRKRCVEKVNGFFSFAIYDRLEKTVFIARDRMGIKPLLYYKNDDVLFFASELKSIMEMGIPRTLDRTSLFSYLQLNYIPGTSSIFEGVKKLEPGTSLSIHLPTATVTEDKYYQLHHPSQKDDATEAIHSMSYERQMAQLRELLSAAVKRRMIADVPLGSFLSGGIDSSIISALASEYTPHLKTFSIGFADEPHYDETEFANLVAKKIGSDHTVFKLTNDDLFHNVFDTLDYIDEPFADSSALNVFILSKETRKHVTVALSGDGADELFGGYNKHEAELKVRAGGIAIQALKLISPLISHLPQSRSGKFTDLIRKANRMAAGLNLSPADRYWQWAGYANEKKVGALFTMESFQEYKNRKSELLSGIQNDNDISDVLYTDLKMVLVNDMLMKVDLMSMANSLEVRVPFLDYTVVDFATRLPIHTKIDKSGRKKILKDAFRNELPAEIYKREKKGFEVPLLKWFKKEMYALIHDDLLSEQTIRDQGLFNYEEIQKLKRQLFSSNPADSPARIWGLIVFQYWYKRWQITN